MEHFELHLRISPSPDVLNKLNNVTHFPSKAHCVWPNNQTCDSFNVSSWKGAI